MIALLKLALVFAGIVILLNRKWNLGVVLLLAALAIAPLFGYSLRGLVRDLLLTSVDLLTLRLVLAVVLIMALGELLRQTAGLKGIVEALQALIPNGRVVIAALPALVGLLPMIGGAMFSAPMVDEVGDRLGVDRERKTFVNYWFRHIWEYIFPLYPSMILAAALLGMTTGQLARAAWPLTAMAVVAGLLFGLLGLPRRGKEALPAVPRAESWRTLATSIWPVALVVVVSLGVPIDEDARLIIGLVVTIALLMAVKRVPLVELGTILRRRIPWQTVLVVYGALAFRAVLEGSGAVQATSLALTGLRIPLVVVAFAVPFVAGLLTGLSAGAFGIAFPVVMPLVAPAGGAAPDGWAVWMMVGGFMGTMFSPVHLCLSLTRVYFKANWGPIYRLIAPSALMVVATAAAILLLG